MDTCSYDVYKLLAEIKENNKFKWRFLPSKEKRQKKLAVFWLYLCTERRQVVQCYI